MSIADNIARVRDKMQEAALLSGRNEKDVRLIAVTKYVDVDKIAEAVSAGIKDVGENRVQEFLSKEDFFSANNLSVNLIGQLQTNKVKYITGRVSLIHSVDRLPLVLQIDRAANALGIVQDVLIEVNMTDEAKRGGVQPDELTRLLEACSAVKGVRVRGLMCIPPVVDEAAARDSFAKLRRLSEDVSRLSLPNVFMDELSMGMSGDFASAIQEGATIIRVGSAIFGARRYPVTA